MIQYLFIISLCFYRLRESKRPTVDIRLLLGPNKTVFLWLSCGFTKPGAVASPLCVGA